MNHKCVLLNYSKKNKYLRYLRNPLKYSNRVLVLTSSSLSKPKKMNAFLIPKYCCCTS